MSAPVRVQRKRTKGWRMPPNTVYVGRPSKWGNEFPVGQFCQMNLGGTPSTFTVRDAAQAVALFEHWQLARLPIEELRGKNLACWCPLDQPCHADSLLRVANRPHMTEARSA